MNGKPFEVDAVKYEQDIKVTGTATGAPAAIFIYLKKDKDAAEKAIMAKKLTSPVLLNKVETTGDFTLQATIPANETAVVEVDRVNKAANVHIKITNR